MNVIERLASSLGRRDEQPNIELAELIVQKKDKNAVQILIDQLEVKGKDLQNDSIKVLYEIGDRKPELIAPHLKAFVGLLTSKNNRLQWGAMSALQTLVSVDPKGIYASLPKILDAADKGTVITKDGAMKALAQLGAEKQYRAKVLPLMIDQLVKSPDNQFPTYAESILPLIDSSSKDLFIKTLKTRLPNVEVDSKRKRIEKAIAKAGKV